MAPGQQLFSALRMPPKKVVVQLYASCSPPNSGEFGYTPNQPLGVSPRFLSETDAIASGDGSPLSGPSGRLSPGGRVTKDDITY